MPHRGSAQLGHQIRIGFRYYSEWKRSLESGSNALSDGVAWITFEARDFVESILTPGALVFEYGSGGSTLFYSKRAKRVVSIEHDANWANSVELALSGFENCERRLIPPQKASAFNDSPNDPRGYCSSDEQYKGYSFREYVSSVDSFPDQYFDIVAIDGRARPSCILHARLKVKVGGYLILDNSERTQYQKAKHLLSGWKEQVFYGPGPYNYYFWETSAWQRLS